MFTRGDLEEVGIPKVAEMALDCAWDGTQAVYLSYHFDIHSFVLYQGWAGRFPWNSAELFRRNGCRQLEVDSVAAVPLKTLEFVGNVEIPRKSSQILGNPEKQQRIVANILNLNPSESQSQSQSAPKRCETNAKRENSV